MSGFCLAVILWLALQLPVGLLLGCFLRKGKGAKPVQATERFAHYSWRHRARPSLRILRPIFIAETRSRHHLPR